jgi:hypothetical protein
LTTTGRAIARDDTAAGSPPVLVRRQDVRVVQVNGGRQADSRRTEVEDPDGYILCFSEQMTSP